MTIDEQPAAEPAPRVSWDASHKRWTVWIPLDVFDAITAESVRSGRSKTAIVTKLLREGLHV
jgi:hypothetical protein